jgi:hypothetical protein
MVERCLVDLSHCVESFVGLPSDAGVSVLSGCGCNAGDGEDGGSRHKIGVGPYAQRWHSHVATVGPGAYGGEFEDAAGEVDHFERVESLAQEEDTEEGCLLCGP